MKALCVSAGAAWVILTLTACGSSSTTSATSGAGSPATSASPTVTALASTTDTGYLDRADVICAAAYAVARQQAPYPGMDSSRATAATLPAWEKYYAGLAVATSDMSSQLAALQVPPGQDAFAGYVAAVGTAVADDRAAATAAHGTDLAAFKAAASVSNMQNGVSLQAAQRAGLKVCR